MHIVEEQKGNTVSVVSVMGFVGAVLLLVGAGCPQMGADYKASQDVKVKSDTEAMMVDDADESNDNDDMVAVHMPTVRIALGQQSSSGQKGTLALSEVNGQVKATLEVSGTPSGSSEPAHIHVGACPSPGAVKYPLANVVNGKSETMLAVSLQDLLKEGSLSVNVHKSAAELQVYVACGDIKNVAADAMMKINMTGVMMKDGKMMVVAEGGSMTEMKNDMMLENGAKVMMNGKVMMKDGKTMMLKANESMSVDGEVKMMTGGMIDKKMP